MNFFLSPPDKDTHIHILHNPSDINMAHFLGDSAVKHLPANAGGVGLIPGSGRSSGERNGNPLQYSCLGNSTERGACLATVQEVAKSWTHLND